MKTMLLRMATLGGVLLAGLIAFLVTATLDSDLPSPVRIVLRNEVFKEEKHTLLIIPSLGVKAPVVESASEREEDIQEALIQGVAHYPETPLPGETGNAVLLGHSSDFFWIENPWREVFAALPHMQIGEEVFVVERSGRVIRFRVREAKTLSREDLSVLSPPETNKAFLTLITSYPTGTAWKRFAVVSERID